MIQVQHIFDEEAILAERGDEQLVDPLTNAFAYRDWLAFSRRAMSCHDHASLRQVLTQWEPTSLKQLDDLTGVHPGHACRRWMSECTLELGMLQNAIASSSRYQIDACGNELRNHHSIPILPIETNQSDFWGKREVLQVG